MGILLASSSFEFEDVKRYSILQSPETGSKWGLTMQVPKGHAFCLPLLDVHGSTMDVGSAGELRENVEREWVGHVGHPSMG